MEFILILTEVNMKDNGLMTEGKVLECKFIQMEIHMKEIGKIIKNMEMEFKH